MTTYVDIHALQTLPPSNINRDQDGAPKTAIFGGVPRQRVSSQAWKHAIRKDFNNDLPENLRGIRTKRVTQKIAEAIIAADPQRTKEDAEAAAVKVLGAAKIKTSKPNTREGEEERAAEAGYLLFLSTRQIEKIAQAIVDSPDLKFSKKDLAALFDSDHSFDIAMFGRMIADAPEYNVDAAVQVAHAIGVSATEPDFDFFTAVDDIAHGEEETGAGMLGTVQMMSSTLYRYATVNVDALEENLGDPEAAVEATKAFLSSFISSLPTGKINTFANQTLPYAVVVAVRTDRPVSWVNAFEEPLANTDSGYRDAAAERLAKEATSIGAMCEKDAEATWVLTQLGPDTPLAQLGDVVNRKELMDSVSAAVATALSEDQ